MTAETAANRQSLATRLSSSFGTLLRSTAGTAQIFKAFKTPRSSTFINELHSVTDWLSVTSSATYSAACNTINAIGTGEVDEAVAPLQQAPPVGKLAKHK